MLRDPAEPGWHTPPLNEPPRDYADPEPAYKPLHPLRKGAAAAWAILGVLLASPFIIIAAVFVGWWRVALWLINDR